MTTVSPPRTLTASSLTVQLGRRIVLQDLDLPDLQTGTLVALLGPNGSGKSTLLKSLAGIVPTRSATLQLGNQPLNDIDASQRARKIRYLPQHLPGNVHLTVFESVLVALRARERMSADEAISIAQATLVDLGISHLGAHYLDELSGGQKQLVGLAQTLGHTPDVLLLDEPLASLDLNFQHHVMQTLARLTRERGMLTLIVLHDLNTAMRYADQAILMSQGTIVATGTPSSVITPQNLARTFSVHARIECSAQGRPYVLVDDLIRL